MTKFKIMALSITFIGLVVLSLSGFTIYKTSFHKSHITRDSTCFGFLHPDTPCKYVEEAVDVTTFKPFNELTLVVIPLLFITYLVTVILFSIGQGGLNTAGRVLFLSLGVIMFGLLVGGFCLYGNSQKGEVITGGLTSEEKACVDSLKDLSKYMNNLDNGTDKCPSNMTFDDLSNMWGPN